MIVDVWTHLDAAGAAWLRAAVADVQRRPGEVGALFAAVGRHCGRCPLVASDPEGLVHGTVDDAARQVLLTTLTPAGPALAREVADLYRFGAAAERRAVLRGLAALDIDGGVEGRLTHLVLDGLRTNDRRLVAAALGPYARRIDNHDWRHGVLKCLFMGVPLAAVADLADRTDAALAGMFVAFAQERMAAGRDVPPDTWLVVDRFPDPPSRDGRGG